MTKVIIFILITCIIELVLAFVYRDQRREEQEAKKQKP